METMPKSSKAYWKNNTTSKKGTAKMTFQDMDNKMKVAIDSQKEEWEKKRKAKGAAEVGERESPNMLRETAFELNE